MSLVQVYMDLVGFIIGEILVGYLDQIYSHIPIPQMELVNDVHSLLQGNISLPTIYIINIYSQWSNPWFGSSLNITCLPVYPSCDDTTCQKNSYCLMFESGPTCICEEGYNKYEDGSCLKPEIENEIIQCGTCDTDSGKNEWTNWLNSDHPSNSGSTGDWESLNGFKMNQVCPNPSGIEARRTNGIINTPLVTHISPEAGFWCINSEQDGTICDDFEVRFCCPKYQIGSCEEIGFNWSSWINGDNEAGTGDWEMTTSMGDSDICSNPQGIRAREVGHSDEVGSIANPEVTHIDLNLGFWCLHEENQFDCPDFEVSYCCPAGIVDDSGITTISLGECQTDVYKWTNWLNSDSPDGPGDQELIHNFAQNQICQTPLAIQARTVSNVGNAENLHINLESGFLCLNDKNQGQCADFEVRFCCPIFKTGECDQRGYVWTGWYNDDRDEPSNRRAQKLWVSSSQEIEEVQVYGEGGACRSPLASHVRVRPTGSTSFQTVMTEYAKELKFDLTPSKYHCVNEGQDNDRKCVDMEISFCCPASLEVRSSTSTSSTSNSMLDNGWNGDGWMDGLGRLTDIEAGGDGFSCTESGYEWSQAINVDNPNSDGDWETLFNHPIGSTCANPTAIKATPLDDGAMDVYHLHLDFGFYCLNSEQNDGNVCADFEVQYCCPKYQIGHCNLKGYDWTDWLNNDIPADSGDWELLASLNPNQACSHPTGVKVKDVGIGGSVNPTHLSLRGFYCLNEEQPAGLKCADFAVSYCCPVANEINCEKADCGENRWCMETITGSKCICGDDDYNDDSDDDDFILTEQGTCLPADLNDSKTTVTVNDVIYDAFTVGHCNGEGHDWSNIFNKDTPTTGSGDFELFSDLTRGEICLNPTGMRALTSSTGQTNWPLVIDLEIGLICIESDQIGPSCFDYGVQYCCPSRQIGTCDQQLGYSWTDWQDVDDGDGFGDWEFNKIETSCVNPTGLKVDTVWDNPFNAVTHLDLELGFWCLNEENNDVMCEDYQVSWCCPTLQEGICDDYGHVWKNWIDLDNPDGENGDVELKSFMAESDTCLNPTAIRAQISDNGRNRVRYILELNYLI